MSKLELKVAETTTVVAEPPKVEVVEGPKPFKQRIASNWHIVANGKGIIATSNMGDRFEGSIKDFNKALKVQ